MRHSKYLFSDISSFQVCHRNEGHATNCFASGVRRADRRRAQVFENLAGAPTAGLVLFSQTEPAEHAVQNIFGVDGADDLPQFIQRQADLQRDNLVARTHGELFPCLIQTV
jgi:hypothetical protein